MTSSQPKPVVVMHLIDTGGPGGAETVFSQLAGFDGGDDIRALPVVPREGWLSERLRSLGMKPIVLPARGSLNFGYFKTLLKIAREHHVRLIHTHLLGSAVYGGLLGLLTGIPVIAVLHGPTDLRTPGKFALIKRWLLAHGCSAVVAVSTSTREALIDFGLKPEKIILIQNGVDTALYFPGHAEDLRVQLQLESQDILIGAVGNIRNPKAYDILLQAAALVLERVPHAYFAVIGEGNEEKLHPLRELQHQLGLHDRFRFLGFRKSTAQLYHNFDVFVSSSRTEGLSLSFLEAMATGKAIVATRSGGPQEALVEGESGLLVPIEDPQRLAQALIETATDTALRARLGFAARTHVEQHFSLAATIEKYRVLYRSLMLSPSNQ